MNRRAPLLVKKIFLTTQIQQSINIQLLNGGNWSAGEAAKKTISNLEYNYAGVLRRFEELKEECPEHFFLQTEGGELLKVETTVYAGPMGGPLRCMNAEIKEEHFETVGGLTLLFFMRVPLRKIEDDIK